MATILMALAFGAISMIIVFISGMASGVVRLGTVSIRSFVAFCVSSIVVYILLMIFEMYDERRRKELDTVAKELAEGENSSDTVTTDATGGFQPINPTDIPRA